MNTLSVLIKNATTTLFEGKASAVSSVNEKGDFSILPFHANFISMIKEKIVVYPISGEKKEIKINDHGVLNVQSNNVSVFLGIEIVAV